MENYTQPKSLRISNENQELSTNKISLCHICFKVFSTKSNLEKHILIHEGKKPYNCCVCSKRFTQKSNLITHFRKHSGIFPYKCSFCSKGFNRQKVLEKHKLQHHIPTFLCNICNKKFFHKADLLSHRLLHNDNKKLPFCDVCQKCFANRANLKVHSRIHLNELPYACSHCGKRFRQNHVLKRHILVHVGERPYCCNICRKQFSTQNVLKIHHNTHLHKFTCTTCDMKFNDCDALNKHSLLHTGIFPFVCNLCNKGFVNNHLLEKHQIIHSCKQPFVCDICDKKFKYKGNLTSHRLIHLSTAHFVCETCGKDFIHKSNFRRHLQIHNNEKPFICNVCDAHFTAKHSLKVHSLKHSNSAPTYKCETCGQCFRSRSTLNYHNLKHLSNLFDEKKNTISANEINHQNSVIKSSEIKLPNGHQDSSIVSQETNIGDIQTASTILKSNSANNLNIPIANSLSSCNYTTEHKSIELRMKQYPRIAPKPTEVPPVSSESSLAVVPNKLIDTFSSSSGTSPHKINNPLIIYSDVKTPAAVFIINNPIEVLKCSVCAKDFKNEKILSQHMLVHVKDRPHICNICKQTFTAKSSLKRHLQRHTNHPLFQCNTCLKSFYQLGNLKVHQNKCVSNEIRCNGEYSKNGNIVETNLEMGNSDCMNKFEKSLRTTEIIDESSRVSLCQRNWKCEKCNKSFKLYTLLKIHKCSCGQILCTNQKEVVRNGDINNLPRSKIVMSKNDILNQIKRYPVFSNDSQHKYLVKFTEKCSICNISFSNNSILQRHIIAVHFNKELYKCSCKRSFKNKLIYRAHCLTHIFDN